MNVWKERGNGVVRIGEGHGTQVVCLWDLELLLGLRIALMCNNFVK